jgi:hypothetical protein
MTALIGALRVSLSAETAQFEAGMRRAQRQTQSAATSINKSLATVKAGLGGFAAAFSVGLLATGITRALQYAGSLGEISQQLGVTTRDLQTFRYAAGQVGVSQEELEKGLLKLTVTLGQVAAGAKAPTKALQAIGVTADQLKGKNTGEAFRIIADGLEKVTDRSQRAAVEMALFGRSGAKLDNLLAGGRGAIDELSAAAEKLGIVLSDRQIQEADETADKLEAVKTVLAANIAGVVADNASSIVSLASALAQLTGQIIRFLNSNPTAALAILGALLGGRVGGLPGAAVGAFAGAVAGAKFGGSRGPITEHADPLLRHNFIKAVDEGKAARLRGDTKAANEAYARAKRLRTKFVASGGVVPGFNDLPAGTDIGQFLASGGGGGKKGRDTSKDAERERLKALRDAFQFNQDLRRGQMDILQAQRDLALTADERASIEMQMLDLDKAGFQAELEYQVAAGDISKAQADQLQAQYDKADALKRQAVAEDLAASKAREAAELTANAFDIQLETLALEANLAETASERRAIELRMLDVAYQRERAALMELAASKDVAEAKAAQARLAALDAQHSLRREGVIQGTRGPMEQFRADFSDIGEELEQLKVNGIMGAVDALTALTDGWGSFRDAALSAIKQVIAELIRLQLMKLAASFIGGATGSFAGAGGGAITGGGVGALNFGGTILGGSTSLAVPGMARGGSGIIGGFGGVDRNVLSLNGLPIARVSRGEGLTISPDGMGSGGISMTNHFSFSGPVTRQTEMQLASVVRRTITDASKRGY